MSVFFEIPQNKTSSDVAHQIEGLVLEGILRAGEQLPGERELAQSTTVSRPVVREAITLLVERGVLFKKQGGGTYVSNIIGDVFSQPIAELLSRHKKATVDYLEYRREVESTAAGLAAERATNSDKVLLKELLERMKIAHEKVDDEEEARLDIEFHTLVSEMAHNLVLLHTMRACYNLLKDGIFRNREHLYVIDGRQILYEQHLAIADAILKGDKEGAIKESRSHLCYILDRSLEVEEQVERERIAELRLQQRTK
ncbi:MAG: FadR/GntR family transcriptional regulator [Nitratireductor sp.]